MKSGYYLDTNRHLVGYLAEEEVTNTGNDSNSLGAAKKSLTEFRRQMRSDDLLVYLSLNCP